MNYQKLHEWSLKNELAHPEYAELMSELRFTFYEHQSVGDLFYSAQQNQANKDVYGLRQSINDPYAGWIRHGGLFG